MVIKTENSRLIIFIFLLYAWTFRNILNRIPMFKYTDELIACIGGMMVVKYVWSKRRIAVSAFFFVIGIIIFAVAGLIGSYVYEYQPIVSVALPDLLLSVKFFGWIAVGYFLSIEVDCKRLVKTLGKHARILICIIFTLVIIDVVFHVFNNYSDIKFGMRAVGLYEGPSSLASSATSLLCLYLMSKKKVSLSKEVVMAILIMLSTLRYKSLAAIAVLVIIITFGSVTRKRIKWWHMALLAVVAIFVARQQLYIYLIQSSGNARTVLWVTSLQILRDHFPIGTGFGTFASYYSGISYSPVYGLYGISGVHGLSEGRTSFISDTFWPMVIGQTGIIGTLGYCLSMWLLYKAIQKNIEINKNIYYASIYAYVYLLITSTSESAYLHWNSMFLAMILGIALMFSVKEKALLKGMNK